MSSLNKRQKASYKLTLPLVGGGDMPTLQVNKLNIEQATSIIGIDYQPGKLGYCWSPNVNQETHELSI